MLMAGLADTGEGEVPALLCSSFCNAVSPMQLKAPVRMHLQHNAGHQGADVAGEMTSLFRTWFNLTFFLASPVTRHLPWGLHSVQKGID